MVPDSVGGIDDAVERNPFDIDKVLPAYNP
jgi:hypothetical protein